MAVKCVRWSKTIMLNYYSSLVLVFSLSMFVIFYYYFNENLLADDSSNNNMFKDFDFDDRINEGAEIQKNRVRISTISSKCRSLNEIALEMLYNVEQILLPYETNKTRWEFQKTGNLNYLKSIYKKWSGKGTRGSHNTKWINDINSTKARDIKAKKYFITFGCNCCVKSKLKAIKAAKSIGGFDFSIAHDIYSLSERFREAHPHIWRQSRGCGFWLWKPYIILKTFVESMFDNDILMYQDAGAHFIKDAGPLLKLAQVSETGIILFHTEYLERKFTKRDAFMLMEMDYEMVYNSYQRLASFLLLRKNCRSLQFVMEWLAYASDPRILTNMRNMLGKQNHPDFTENRHDQSVLSLLSKRWQLEEFRDPSQYGNTNQNFMNELGPYAQLIYHSRDTS